METIVREHSQTDVMINYLGVDISTAQCIQKLLDDGLNIFIVTDDNLKYIDFNEWEWKGYKGQLTSGEQRDWDLFKESGYNFDLDE